MAGISPVHEAPGELEFVRAFVNTLDVETGVDDLRDPSSWHSWATKHGISGSSSVEDLDFARGVRESIREGMLANHQRAPLPAETLAALNDAAARTPMTVTFTEQGARLAGSASGVDAALARTVAALAQAMADDTWSRLKACVNDECRWGFYDTSRSRTGQWCSMSLCGNRAKQTRWRNAPERSATSQP